MDKMIDFSGAFLYAAKRNDDLRPFYAALRSVELSAFVDALKEDTQKQVFWMNMYNALVLDGKKRREEAVNGLKLPKSFFIDKAFFFETGQYALSLDEIEHGILRRQKAFFSSSDYHPLRVNVLDARIHFALNCGAKSCPPIRIYALSTLDLALNEATQTYLETESSYTATSNTLEISELLKWYIDDFGGELGLISFLKKYQIIPQDAQPKLVFSSYDWTTV